MNKLKDLQTELIARCKMNDPRAQMQIYDRYCQAMFNTAWRFVRREDEAQDFKKNSNS